MGQSTIRKLAKRLEGDHRAIIADVSDNARQLYRHISRVLNREEAVDEEQAKKLGYCSIKDFAQAAGVSYYRAAAMLSGLHRAGHVKRIRVTADSGLREVWYKPVISKRNAGDTNSAHARRRG